MVGSYLTSQKRGKLKNEIFQILVYQAGKKCTITYGELCKRIKCANIAPNDKILNELLGEISTESAKSNECMLSVLVVKKNTQIPGNGFFSLAKDNGFKIVNRELFIKAQIELVHEQYRDKGLLTV